MAFERAYNQLNRFTNKKVIQFFRFAEQLQRFMQNQTHKTAFTLCKWGEKIQAFQFHGVIFYNLTDDYTANGRTIIKFNISWPLILYLSSLLSSQQS